MGQRRTTREMKYLETKKSQISGLSFHHKKQEEQIKFQVSQRIEIITKINEIDNRKTLEKVNKIKSLIL